MLPVFSYFCFTDTAEVPVIGRNIFVYFKTYARLILKDQLWTVIAGLLSVLPLADRFYSPDFFS